MEFKQNLDDVSRRLNSDGNSNNQWPGLQSANSEPEYVRRIEAKLDRIIEVLTRTQADPRKKLP